MEEEEDIEKHLTIVRNPKSRRGSFSNYAFPELHPQVDQQHCGEPDVFVQATLRAEPESLLLLTRTRKDSGGRKQSVSVPLIPPPDGERFEGGYYVKRHPITGGARLVAPNQCTTGNRIIVVSLYKLLFNHTKVDSQSHFVFFCISI